MAHLRIVGDPEGGIWPTVEVGPGQTLLQAAIAAGVPLPYGCRSGLCGACRVHVVAGEVVHDRHAAAALSAAERARGLVLSCRARPVGDVTLALPATEPVPPRPRRFVTRIVARRDLGARTTELALEPPGDGLPYLAGQYATLALAGCPPRDFSFAGLPGDAALTFHLRDTGSGGAAAAAATMRPGDAVTVEAPFGRAYFRPAERGPLLLIAGGTGLAPMLSVARAALAADPGRLVTLCLGAASPADLYGEETLARLGAGHATFSCRIGFTAPTADAAPAATAVDLAIAAAGRMVDPVVHAAGPPAMVVALRRRLREAGMRPAAFRADAFTPVRELAG
ncbi:hypothetical protein STVA_53510 [Allostella vacuolata]|nr:hypothetical protein STVA_53510 [Stella vacuolata]